MKPDGWLETLNCAVEGVLHAVRTQRHMRWHLLAAAAVLLLCLVLPVGGAEFGVLCLAVALVLVAELVNTAVEAVVDLASPQFHELARSAKDVAAGAVLVAAFAAAAVGWAILFPLVESGALHRLGPASQREPLGVAVIALLVLALVVAAKAASGRGSPLHGGFPSGHAAVSFAAATVLTLRSRDLLVGAVSVLLALMVSHSRLLLRIHTASEVAAGAALGVASAALLYWLLVRG
ncbi:MAG: phosphatase PAP2 family protein [Deltaproteobacteria bacterium]|nr:phosphatase PAP2 family protein [Deltaproteobacteria bacterium]